MIIDIHGHITPPELLKRLPMPPSLADIDGMLEQKARAGIDLTIVGSPVGVGTMMRLPGMTKMEQTPDQLKGFHDWLVETVAKHPGRLKAYAFTNPFGGDRMLQDAAKTVKDGGFVGLIVNTSVDGEYLASERADSFFAMAAALDVPIFLHPPAEPVGSACLQDFRLVEQVARHCDMTVSLAALIFSGYLAKYPNLRVIGAMGGGAISLLPHRLDVAYKPSHWGAGPPQSAPGRTPGQPGQGGPPSVPTGPRYENKISENPSTFLKRLYVDTACYSAPTMLANLQMLGADHILFGTDSPPASAPLQESISLIADLPLSAGDKQKIFSGNAQRLFNLA